MTPKLSKLAYAGNWTGPVFCERCGARLDPRKIVWLELSTVTGNYHDEKHPIPEAEAGGCFPFGKDCAKIVLEGIEVNHETP